MTAYEVKLPIEHSNDLLRDDEAQAYLITVPKLKVAILLKLVLKQPKHRFLVILGDANACVRDYKDYLLSVLLVVDSAVDSSLKCICNGVLENVHCHLQYSLIVSYHFLGQSVVRV